MRSISLTLLFILLSIASPENDSGAVEGKNYTARYLEGAGLRCETNSHREILLRAFHDIINLPSGTLRKLKYEDDKTNEKKLSLLDVFNRYITPNRPEKTIGPGFYDELKTDEVRYRIKDILYALKANKKENKNTVPNSSWGKDECLIRIKSSFDITIPQSAENVTCLEETMFTRSIYIMFTLPSAGELKLFLTENANLLGPPVVYSNPLKGMAVNRRLKAKWHPELLRPFSGGTHSLWKKKEQRTYCYVFGRHDDKGPETVYLVCVSE